MGGCRIKRPISHQGSSKVEVKSLEFKCSMFEIKDAEQLSIICREDVGSDCLQEESE
jgi:hypothetical protein